MGTLSPDGEHVWWFADTDGDEFGVWRTQPFAGGDDAVALPEGEPAYPAGLAAGRTPVANRRPPDHGSAARLAPPRGAPPAGYPPTPPPTGRRPPPDPEP